MRVWVDSRMKMSVESNKRRAETEREMTLIEVGLRWCCEMNHSPPKDMLKF